MKISRKLLTITECIDYIELTTDAALYRIYAMNDDMFRIRCSFDREFAPEASYALVMTAWDDAMDHVIKDRKKITALSLKIEEHEHDYRCTTKNLVLKIVKEPFAIIFEDHEGVVLHQDVGSRSYVQDDLNRIYHYSVSSDEDYYYGFGEKSGLLNKRNRRLRMQNVDTLGYNSESTDPLYKHIPFYIKFNGKNQSASGMFYHNTHQSTFDVGMERSGYWPKYTYYSADGGELDYFFIHGPMIKQVVQRYTDLTGKSILTPKFSLGYLGSTMFYTELEAHSDRAILGFLEQCEEQGIPCDGFFMSSGYTTGKDGKRYVFNWNKDRFPDPAQFVEQSSSKGITLSPNIKPGMLTTHPLYEEFSELGLFIKDEHAQAPVIDRYWGGAASFVDFSKPAARERWKSHMKQQLLNFGFTSIWNDNNEYEIQQTSAQCDYEGEGKPISALSSVMPNLMALTAVEAIEENNASVRPYVINRAGYAGIQRYAQTWAGDNYTSWHSLKFNIPLILGLGLSGVANQGCDIGGFFGPAPEPELFVRWVQNGIFQPRFSIHSSNTDNTVTEPWMYPSYTQYIRDAIQLRYQLIPYYYSLLYEASVSGAPIMRPLVYEFQDDPQVWEESFQFMIGASLLVANVVEPEVRKHSIYLPRGANWVDWSTKKRYEGGQYIELEVTLSSIPMFIRSGGIIPLATQLRNIHLDTIKKLVVLIEGSQDGSFTYYDDDGVSSSYKNENYYNLTIDVDAKENTIITFTEKGLYHSPIEELEIQVLCSDNSPIAIELDDVVIPRFLNEEKWKCSDKGWYFDIEYKMAYIKYVHPRSDHKLKVDFSVKDLISI
ncbi:glycoside hydrolase family 31 protein [Paenibacillus sp. FSL W7-1287]|uniref:glycoside hydrolase family 31 protein n=1 Tax=Paenibacillus sp. FSL W7-1287 TaxID=2954538 RepID=UPI0030F63AE0